MSSLRVTLTFRVYDDIATPALSELVAELSKLDVDFARDRRELRLDLLDCLDQLVRLEPDVNAAAAGEFGVRLEPADRLLVFLAALRAWK